MTQDRSFTPEEKVPEGESRWLIERTTDDDPRRQFWTGDGWVLDALRGARYESEHAAVVTLTREFQPNARIEACEHLFQCGVSDLSERTFNVAPYPDLDTAKRDFTFGQLWVLGSQYADLLNAAPQEIAEQKPQESSASFSLLAEGPATQDRPAAAAPMWVSPTDRNPDLDGRLWAVLTERRENGKRAGFITAYEYYHFTDGWATNETILFWLDSPLHPLPSVPRE